MKTPFTDFWSTYGNKSLLARGRYFSSLTKPQQEHLVQSFYDGGWDKFFIQMFVDQLLDNINEHYGIDLIDLRIKAIKHNRVFLIDKHVWSNVTSLIDEWRDLYDTNIIFGGLEICSWGKREQFCKIKAKKQLHWR